MAPRPSSIPSSIPGAIVPVRDRCLAVDEAFAQLLPDAGLRRGHVVGCGGPAALTLAIGLAARSVVTGSWLAVIGVPMLGVEAMAAMGIPLERVVAIDAGVGPREWAERVAAVIDGFELVLTRPPAGVERYARKVGHRLQARGAVILPIGAISPGMPCDLELTTTSLAWSGLDDGAGHLTARRARVRAAGRRLPRPVDAELWLPGPDGRVATTPGAANRARTDDPLLRRAG